MKVIFWLSIIPGVNGLWGGGDLWRREITTGCVPLVGQGDGVYCWSTEEDGPCGGLRLEPRSRFVDDEGRWHVELARLIVDPTDRDRNQILARIQQGQGYEYAVWYTSEHGGQPPDEETLRTAGWTKQ